MVVFKELLTGEILKNYKSINDIYNNEGRIFIILNKKHKKIYNSLFEKKIELIEDFYYVFFYEFKENDIFNIDIEKLIGYTDIIIFIIKRIGTKLLKNNKLVETVKNNKELILEGLKYDLIFLEFVNQDFLTDRNFIFDILNIICISKYLYFFSSKFFKENIKNDREIVLKMVKCDGRILEYTNEILRDDKEIVLNAIYNFNYSFRYASKRLQHDLDISLIVLNNTHDYNIIKYCNDDIKNNYILVLEIVKRDGLCLEHAGERLKNTYEIVLAAVKNNGLSLKYVSEKLRNNKEIVLTAYKQTRKSFVYAGREITIEKLFAIY